jgi:hypothetical protein
VAAAPALVVPGLASAQVFAEGLGGFVDRGWATTLQGMVVTDLPAADLSDGATATAGAIDWSRRWSGRVGAALGR